MTEHLFGEIAIELNFMARRNLETALERQTSLKEIWANSKLGEVLILMGVLDGLQVDQVLMEQRLRRGTEQKPAPAFPYYKDYLILRKLGEGGMGEVFLADEYAQRRKVVLKMLRKDKAANAQVAARFQQEAQIAGMLEHSNIVACYTTGVAHGARFLVLEYVEGESLYERIERCGPLDDETVLRLATHVLRGLAYIHDRGVIHRDIKPGNILLGINGCVKISDFGSARTAHGEFQDFSTIVGTPNYIAPEQIRCSPGVDWRADLYSLGATLYHALSGEVPFKRSSNTAVMRAHLADVPEPLPASVQTDTVRLVSKLMSKDPDGRYVTARQALGDVEKVLARRSVANAEQVGERKTSRGLFHRVAARCVAVLKS